MDPGATEVFRHIALLYAGPAEYLSGLRHFIRSRSEDEAMLIAVSQANSQLLRRELGSESAFLTFTDMTELGRNPARIIPEILGFARRHRGARTRCVAEAAWPGRSAAELRETARHEALANLAFRGISTTLLCPCSTAGMPSTLLASMESTHPSVIREGQEHAGSYDPAAHAQLSDGRLLPEPPGDADALDYARDLRPVRQFVATASRRAGLAPQHATDFILAVSELAANTLRHTGAGGTVTLWSTRSHVICQVQDTGLITDPLAGHRLPSADVPGGKGLWLVNQLCDLVQRQASPAGTVTRLHLRLSPG